MRLHEEPVATLYLQHPYGMPDDLIGVLPYLIDEPSRLASTAAWLRFRDKTLYPMMWHRPDDVNLPKFLRQVDAVLAYRAKIAPEHRFWRADPEIGFGGEVRDA